MPFLNPVFGNEMASRPRTQAINRSGHPSISSHGPKTASTIAFERQESASFSSTMEDPKIRRIATIQQNDTADNSSRPQTAPDGNGNLMQLPRQPVHSRTGSETDDNERPTIRGGRITPHLQRSRTDFGPRVDDTSLNILSKSDDGSYTMRHGWEDQYTSDEYLGLLSSVGSTNLYLDIGIK